MKHKRFEENILIDDAYTNYGRVDKNADLKKGQGIAKHFADTLQYDERKKWYHQLPEETPSGAKLSALQIEELKKKAASMLHGDALSLETKNGKGGNKEQQWARTLLHKGAIGDRVAAATILIQENPVHNLPALRNLINNVKPAKKKDGLVIIDAVSELLISELLMPDFKLRKFEQHSLADLDTISSGNKARRRNILKLWYYEDQLKQLYEVYVDALDKFGHDSVEANREKSVGAMSYLLSHHPEKEKELLGHLVNKLGDSAGSVCSKVGYHLCRLLYHHPNMKSVLLKEVRALLFRSNISPRAQYYAVCLLNQFYLHRDDTLVADALVDVYFSFFKATIKKGDIDSRLMAALLTGVKRALPYCARERGCDEHAAALHRLVHLGGDTVALHALTLLQLTASEDDDRYYCALYRKLLAPGMLRLAGSSAPLHALLLKSLRGDRHAARRGAFVKRLLQLALHAPPHCSVALLLLLSHALRHHRERAHVNHEPAAQEEAKKDETNPSRGSMRDLFEDDGEDERYSDLDSDTSDGRCQQPTAVSGWFHARLNAEAQTQREEAQLEADIIRKKTINMEKSVREYQPLSRNPRHCGAEWSACFELAMLANHHHPTVGLFARQLLHDQPMEYDGDPLIDFSGARFLDRFVFKNPKKRAERTDDGSERVRGSHPKFAIRRNYRARGVRAVPVTSASYLDERPARIPVDEHFLYEYLRGRRDARDTASDDDDDNSSVTSEQFDDYLDIITGTHAPDDSDEELDYLADMNFGKQDDDDDDDEDDDDKDEDDEVAEEANTDSDDGELDIRADEDEDELALEESDSDTEGAEGCRKRHNLKLKGSEDLGSLFASAEQFSTLLEDNTCSRQGSSHAASNKDRSSQKQLNWEDARDHWIRGYNRKVLGKRKPTRAETAACDKRRRRQ